MVAEQGGVAGTGPGPEAAAEVVQVLVDGELGGVECESVAAAGQGCLGLGASGVAAQSLELVVPVGVAGQLGSGVIDQLMSGV